MPEQKVEKEPSTGEILEPMQPDVKMPGYNSKTKEIYLGPANLPPNLSDIYEKVKDLPPEELKAALSEELDKFIANSEERSAAFNNLKSIAETSVGSLTEAENEQLAYIQALITKEQKNPNNQVDIIAKAELKDLDSLGKFYESVKNSNLSDDLKNALTSFVESQKSVVAVYEVEQKNSAEDKEIKELQDAAYEALVNIAVTSTKSRQISVLEQGPLEQMKGVIKSGSLNKEQLDLIIEGQLYIRSRDEMDAYKQRLLESEILPNELKQPYAELIDLQQRERNLVSSVLELNIDIQQFNQKMMNGFVDTFPEDTDKQVEFKKAVSKYYLDKDFTNRAFPDENIQILNDDLKKPVLDETFTAETKEKLSKYLKTVEEEAKRLSEQKRNQIESQKDFQEAPKKVGIVSKDIDMKKDFLMPVLQQNFNKQLIDGFIDIASEFYNNSALENVYKTVTYENMNTKDLVEKLSSDLKKGGKFEEGSKIHNYLTKEVILEYSATKKLYDLANQTGGKVTGLESESLRAIVEKLANVSGDYKVNLKDELLNFKKVTGVPIDKITNVFQGK